MSDLIEHYLNDSESPFHKLRHATKSSYQGHMKRLRAACGDKPLSELKPANFWEFYEEWTADGRTSMGNALMAIVRVLVNFGALTIKNEECERLSGGLRKFRFKPRQTNNEQLTAAQAAAIRARAHAENASSIALAQALQFDLELTQKNTIGEWVPLDDASGESDVIYEREKWLRGLRWEEIDANLVLRHPDSGYGEIIEKSLRDAPMVMEELCRIAGVSSPALLARGMLPASGPVVVHDRFGTPWVTAQFRRRWRQFADECGVPKNVFNRNSRPTNEFGRQRHQG